MNQDAVEEIRSSNREIITALDRIERKLDDIAGRMATKDDISRLAKKLDAIRA